jgi:glycosyltransferase involved in cell wall biosynthesis
MKKVIKHLYRTLGLTLLKYLIQYKKFHWFPRFITLFPSLTYKALFELMRRGYVNLAYQISRHYTPHKVEEQALLLRIESMVTIQHHGLPSHTVIKQPIQKVSILFALHNSLPYENAGYAIRTHNVAKHLSLHNHPIVVTTRPGFPWDLQKHKTQKKTPHTQIENITYLRLEDNTKLFKKGSDLDYINHYASQLVEMAQTHNTSILHAHSNYLNGLAVVKASARLKLPSIYEVRGLWHLTRLTLDEAYEHAGMFEYEAKMEKHVMHSVDKIITLSQALKNLMLSWGVSSDKITVIPNTVDTTLFQPKSSNQTLMQTYQLHGKVVIGFIGSLSKYEGLKELILAVDSLIQQGFNLALMIVGEGREKHNLQQLAHSEQIIFTGNIPFHKVPEYYSLFDICPFPRNDFQVCHYVPPLKILEAMAMQKAIIVSNVAPLLEIIEEGYTGLVCETNNVESLQQAIVELYHDKELREKLSLAAYKWVHHYRTIDSMVSQYDTLYTSFLAPKEIQ